MSNNYSFHKEYDLYFVTHTVVGWVDVFTRNSYRQILYDSWEYCRTNRGLCIHAYVLMTNHLHWIISTKEKALFEIIRDFKKFTSKAIVQHMRDTNKESRKVWMLSMFEYTGRNNYKNTYHQFWRQKDRPMPLWSDEVIAQKIHYIHQNPVRSGIVWKAEDFIHSSAGQYAGEDGVFSVNPILLSS